MPRHDDRAGPTRLYVGHLSSRTRSRDLESLFNKYGRVLDVDMKHDFAFIDFSDSRDADDARHYLNGRNVEGNRIVVEFARRGPRGASGSRDYMGRGPPPGTGRCYNCGNDGHWARDCKAGDWKNKCYRCGERGHIERNCHSSPRPNKSRSRSRSRSAEPRHHSRSRSYSRGRSYSRSPMKGNGSASVLEEHPRPRSASRSQSPMSNAKSPTPFSPAANGESLGGSPPLGRDLSVSQSPHKAEAMDDPISPYRDERSPSK